MSGPRNLILIGTSHRFQLGNDASPEVEAFKRFVAISCKQYHVLAIGEEASGSELSSGCLSNCAQVARDIRISHRYCDPTPEQRSRLHIEDVNDLLMGKPDIDILRDQRIRASHAARESYWLDQLFVQDIWPTLFILGALHVLPFQGLALGAGIYVRVCSSDWDPGLPFSEDTPI